MKHAVSRRKHYAPRQREVKERPVPEVRDEREVGNFLRSFGPTEPAPSKTYRGMSQEKPQ